MADEIFSVQQITQALQELIEGTLPSVWVEGEVSNFKESQAGHWYFTLKDDRAQLPCVVWRNVTIRHQHLRPETGSLIRVHGDLTIYPQGGSYQIRSTRLLPVGRGALQLAYEQLRDRLREEGLFAPERKRPLPWFPRHIGVVTSARGAAVQDIIHVIRRRCPCVTVTVYPVVVQGEDAAPQIVRALDVLNRIGAADVVIVGRGGGSMEDLWAFNDERVVRAVVASRIPVVSAVGHEVDYTLTDFAADHRAATPSAAAEEVVPDIREVWAGFVDRRNRLCEAMKTRLRLARHDVDRLSAALSPRRQQQRVRTQIQYLDDLDRRIGSATRVLIDRRRADVGALAAALDALSPLATLKRGYSIAFDSSGRVLRDADSVPVGAGLRIKLHRGELRGVVSGHGDEGRKETDT